jgi:hypothetical protein
VSLLKEEAGVHRASTEKFTPAEGSMFRQKTGCRDQHYREDARKYFFGQQSMIGRKAKIRIFPKKEKPKSKQGVIVYDSRNMIVVQYGKSGWKESFTATDIHDGSVEISLS